MPFFAKRGSEDVLCAFEVWAVKVFYREKEVLRTRFCKDRNTLVARLGNFFQRVRRREMNDVDWRACHLCERDGSIDCFSLRGCRTSQRMINRSGLTFGERFLHKQINHAAVLRVHTHERTVVT